MDFRAGGRSSGLGSEFRAESGAESRRATKAFFQHAEARPDAATSDLGFSFLSVTHTTPRVMRKSPLRDR